MQARPTNAESGINRPSRGQKAALAAEAETFAAVGAVTGEDAVAAVAEGDRGEGRARPVVGQPRDPGGGIPEIAGPVLNVFRRTDVRARPLVEAFCLRPRCVRSPLPDRTA